MVKEIIQGFVPGNCTCVRMWGSTYRQVSAQSNSAETDEGVRAVSCLSTASSTQSSVGQSYIQLICVSRFAVLAILALTPAVLGGPGTRVSSPWNFDALCPI